MSLFTRTTTPTPEQEALAELEAEARRLMAHHATHPAPRGFDTMRQHHARLADIDAALDLWLEARGR